MQFDTTINEWHTCAASGRINASNPCSEYMFLDDTACNLASMNLMAFRREDGSFDTPAFEHAIRLWTVTLEISVLMAQFPSKEIAQLSYEYRTLGLGYANIGGLLMAMGLSYDSDEGRALCGAITAIDDGRQLCHLGRDGGRARRLPRLRRESRGDAARHPQPPPRRAWRDRTAMRADASCRCRSMPRIAPSRPGRSRAHVPGTWRSRWARSDGYRNAQATVIAPTGTIGLVMDCDTTGIEPDFALVKFKKLAGGGYFKIINRIVPRR